MDYMVSSLPILRIPWVFSQSHPLSTSDVTSEAKKRGVDLDVATLRELYHRGDLQPIAELTTRAVRPPEDVPGVPSARGSLQTELGRALIAGRIRDPGVETYRPRMRFDSRKPTDPSRWTNGLIYSQWQLLALPDLRTRLTHRRVSGTYQRRRIVLPALDKWTKALFENHRRYALILMALEARYLPTVDPEWLHLTNVEVDEWEHYRALYDPIASAQTLVVTPEEVRTHAEQLLLRAHVLDPTGDWSPLIRRAPRRTWKNLTGDALIAIDHRLAAEILLLFYEDLAIRGKAMPLPDIPSMAWHPLQDRISAGRLELVDSLLANLGVSPHPGVILVVEGETEELLVPLVFDHLELRRTPDLVRILCMRGADKQLPLVAAVSVAPLLGQRRGDDYDMIRPPTRLMIAVDQDRNWDTDEKVARQRRNIIAEIEKVVAAQGATLSTEDLETLVVVHRWPGKCFEYAHFTDDELATAMTTIHRNCGGLTREELVSRISEIRACGSDVKDVWDISWAPKPTKTALARALWPILKKKIDDARSIDGDQMPRVAEVVHEAYLLAQRSSYGSYVIRAADET
jgi:hypothetical protein